MGKWETGIPISDADLRTGLDVIKRKYVPVDWGLGLWLRIKFIRQ